MYSFDIDVRAAVLHSRLSASAAQYREGREEVDRRRSSDLRTEDNCRPSPVASQMASAMDISIFRRL